MLRMTFASNREGPLQRLSFRENHIHAANKRYDAAASGEREGACKQVVAAQGGRERGGPRCMAEQKHGSKFNQLKTTKKH